MHQHDLQTLAAAEAWIIAAEVRQQLVPDGVTRPLFSWEVRSGTDFLAVDTTIRTAQDQAAAQLDPLRDTIIAALLAVLSGIGDDPAEVQRAVMAFIAAQPPQVQAAIVDAQEAIAQILEQVYGAGGGELLDSAIAQGVTTPDDPADPPPDFRAEAATATGAVWVAIIGALLQPGGSRPGTVADIVGAARGVSVAPAQQFARQAVNVLYSRGRKARLDTLPVPSEIYASELLDRNTCTPCSHVDGKEYTSLTDAYADYPGGGQYVGCLGGDRCRGTLVVVWGEGAPSTFSVKRDSRGRFLPGPQQPAAGPEEKKQLHGSFAPKKSHPDEIVKTQLHGSFAPKVATPAAPPKPVTKVKMVNGKLTLVNVDQPDPVKAAPPAAPKPKAPPTPERDERDRRRFATSTDGKAWASGHWPGPEGYSAPQVNAIRSYTGDGYARINSVLRDSGGQKKPREAAQLDAAMDRAPRVPEDVVVTRNATAAQFGLNPGSDLSSLTGKSFVEHGYLSTSVNAKGAMHGEVQMRVGVPKGTKAIYVSGKKGAVKQQVLSDVGGGESELLIARGGKMRVTAVTRKGKKWIVDVELHHDD